MPNAYTVQFTVNVPGLGSRQVTQTNILAVDVADAIRQAIAGVIVDVTGVQKTA